MESKMIANAAIILVDWQGATMATVEWQKRHYMAKTALSGKIESTKAGQK